MPFSAILDLATPFTAARIAEEMRAHWTAALSTGAHALPLIEDADACPGRPRILIDLGGNTVMAAPEPEHGLEPTSRAFFAFILTLAVGELAHSDVPDIRLAAEIRSVLRRRQDPREALLLDTLPGWLDDAMGFEHLARMVFGANALRFFRRTGEALRPELARADPVLRERILGSTMVTIAAEGLHPLAHLALEAGIERIDELLQCPERLRALVSTAARLAGDRHALHGSLETVQDRLAEAFGASAVEKLLLVPYRALEKPRRAAAILEAACRLRPVADRPADAVQHALSGPDLLTAHPAYAHREHPKEFFLALEESLGRKLTDDELGRFMLAASGIPALVERGWIEPASRRIHTRIHGSS